MDFLTLTVVAFLAGFVDAVVGGGGLIQLPALFVFLPPSLAAQIPSVMGTNKFSSIWGTSAAVIQYARSVPLNWRLLFPTSVVALIASWLGARTLKHLAMTNREPLTIAVLVLMIVVAIYTFIRKDFGKWQRPPPSEKKQFWFGLAVGSVIGFYDGFFGPGTGSFLIFGFVALFGFDFLRASASAKIINLATNIAAVAYFASTGHILYQYAIPMAAANVLGAVIGSRMAVLKGSGFVRPFFLTVLVLLILRFGYETLK